MLVDPLLDSPQDWPFLIKGHVKMLFEKPTLSSNQDSNPVISNYIWANIKWLLFIDKTKIK